MLEIIVSAANARLLQSEVLTVGRVGLRCRLHFDSAWEGLQKTAVVAGSRSVDLFLPEDEFVIPAECLGRAGDSLKIGIYGLDISGGCVIPTVWVNCGEIRPGTELSENTAQEQTQSLLAQIMDIVARAEATAASVRSDADKGVFNGKDGKDGADGKDGKDGADVGTTDYAALENKPRINGVELIGNLLTADLGLKQLQWVTYGEWNSTILKAHFNSADQLIACQVGKDRYLLTGIISGKPVFTSLSGDTVKTIVVDGSTWTQGSLALGTYRKPAGGIPKSDLASDVQTTLGKADGAIPAPPSPGAGQFLVYNGSEWTAQTLTAWQGGNY